MMARLDWLYHRMPSALVSVIPLVLFAGLVDISAGEIRMDTQADVDGTIAGAFQAFVSEHISIHPDRVPILVASAHKFRKLVTKDSAQKKDGSRAMESCTATIGTTFSFCTQLNGLNISSHTPTQISDSSALTTYNALLSSNKIAYTDDCKLKFANFFCVQGIKGCSSGHETDLTPCFQRCLDFQSACLGLARMQAEIACMQSSVTSNTANNSNCFCGANDAINNIQSDTCVGVCTMPSACVGTQSGIGSNCTSVVVTGLAYCTVLDGINVASQADAQAAEKLNKATYTTLATSGIIASSADCTAKYANFFCPQNVNGCNNSIQTTLRPCLKRCLDYQTACLGLSTADAASACAKSSPAVNAPTNADCFCGSISPTSSTPDDICVGPCTPSSECGTPMQTCSPALGQGLPFCAVLDGVNLTSLAAAQSADKYALSNFTALAGAGLIADTYDCRKKYSAFMCPQSVSGCTTNKTVMPILPCLQRCLDYQTSCQQLTATAAASACAKSAGMTNTAANSNCFCGSGDASGAGLYDTCTGQCSALSECGVALSCQPATVIGLKYCAVLNGVNVTSAAAADSTEISTIANYNTAVQANLAATSDDCKAKYLSYMCAQGQGMSGCVVTPGSLVGLERPLLPCLQRCIDYQMSCRDSSRVDAAAKCLLTAGTMNTATNADCFCGVGAGSGGGGAGNGSASSLCVGACPATSPCADTPVCIPSTPKGFKMCTVLNGVSLTSLADAQAAESSAQANYTQLAAANPLANTSECRLKYANFYCPQGLSGCDIVGGQATITPLRPCVQRCLDFQMACLGATADGALTACATPTGAVVNTAHNADCFCGNNQANTAAPYDVCHGPCSPLNDCGAAVTCTPAVSTDLKFCTILDGVSVTTLPALTEADANAAGNYTAQSNLGLVSGSADCRQKYAAFMCPQGLDGCSGTLTSLLPCLQRCLDYHTGCLSQTFPTALIHCQDSVGTTNTGSNANCFCGQTTSSLATAGSGGYCTGACPTGGECGYAGVCAPVTVPSLSYCRVLEGAPLVSADAAYAADGNVRSNYTAMVRAGQAANNSQCMAKYAAYMCPQGVSGCLYVGSTGVTQPLRPCLRRCLDYFTVCLGQPAVLATSSCGLGFSLGMNAAADADCFCGDAGPGSGVCVGPCGADTQCPAAAATSAAARAPAASGVRTAAALLAAAVAALITFA